MLWFLWFYSDAFGDSNVGLLTGDSAINKDAQVLIMTTEILRNMLYQRCALFESFHLPNVVKIGYFLHIILLTTRQKLVDFGFSNKCIYLYYSFQLYLY